MTESPPLVATPEEWKQRAIAHLKARQPGLARLCWKAAKTREWLDELARKRDTRGTK